MTKILFNSILFMVRKKVKYMKKRIISAIVALAIFIPVVYFGGKVFSIAMGMLAVLGYKELLDLKENSVEIPEIIKGIGLIDMLLLIFSDIAKDNAVFGLSYSMVAITLLTLLIPTLFYKDNKYTTREALYLVGIATLLGLVFNTIIFIRSFSLYTLLYLFIICVITDTFAMLTGMLIGKHKACPKISPKKTIEGCIGGSVIGTIVSVIFYSNLVGSFSIKLLIVTLVLTVIGQFGDLFFSKIKRENKIKDFSNIMPGHGGVLDRLDSFCFVIMAYIAFISFI